MHAASALPAERLNLERVNVPSPARLELLREKRGAIEKQGAWRPGEL
jgi:hypothetical protein